LPPPSGINTTPLSRRVDRLAVGRPPFFPFQEKLKPSDCDVASRLRSPFPKPPPLVEERSREYIFLFFFSRVFFLSRRIFPPGRPASIRPLLWTARRASAGSRRPSSLKVVAARRPFNGRPYEPRFPSQPLFAGGNIIFPSTFFSPFRRGLFFPWTKGFVVTTGQCPFFFPVKSCLFCRLVSKSAGLSSRVS